MKRHGFLLCFLLLSLLYISFQIKIVYSSPSIITYDASTNKITCIGGSNGSEIDAMDLWNEDMNNNRTVFDDDIDTPEPPAPPSELLLFGQTLYPACSKAMKVFFDISDYARGGELYIKGKDLDNNFQQENHTISANMSFKTDYWYSELDELTFTTGHEYHLIIKQPRWGEIWNFNSNMTIQLDCLLQFGNGITETWFAEENMTMIFSSSCASANYQDIINIKNNAYFRLGKIVDAIDRTTERGCHILSLTSYYVELIGESGSSMECYVSSFKTTKLFGLAFYSVSNIKIYDCVFEGAYLGLMGYVDMFRVNIQKIASTAFTTYTSPICDDILFHSNLYAFYFPIDGISGTYANLMLRDNSYIAYVYSTYDQYLINVDADTWFFHWQPFPPFPPRTHGKIYRRYEFDLMVTFPNGTAIQNANVTISYDGQGGGVVGSFLTNVNGKINQTLTMGYYHQTGGNVLFDYNPYHLNITYGEYWEYHSSFNLDHKLDWIIALHDPKPKDYAIYFIGVFFIACICFGILYLGWKKRKNE